MTTTDTAPTYPPATPAGFCPVCSRSGRETRPDGDHGGLCYPHGVDFRAAHGGPTPPSAAHAHVGNRACVARLPNGSTCGRLADHPVHARTFERWEGGERGVFLAFDRVPLDEPGPFESSATWWFFGLDLPSRRVALRAAGIDPDGKRRGYPFDGWDHDAAFLAVYGRPYPEHPADGDT